MHSIVFVLHLVVLDSIAQMFISEYLNTYCLGLNFRVLAELCSVDLNKIQNNYASACIILAVPSCWVSLFSSALELKPKQKEMSQMLNSKKRF